eukprot:TRINITY_DN3190_c0_g1_i1.p1 TRINITY_DN3190_c0_g1~~TRINITY_DN3190_c0_g1_i1.p1  ORF type:complete len:164 (-),score=55.51 TRINITY_DN3190_c0_g1_i1:107-598(-)
MIRRPPRSTQSRSSAASDVYKRQHHIENRNTLSDTYYELDLSIDRFKNRICRERRRHIDHGSVAASAVFRFTNRVENRQVKVLLPAFTRCNTTNHLRAVCNCLLRVEGTLRAGEALADNLGIFSYENGHYAASFTALTTFSACLLYTSPSPRDRTRSRMPSSA